MLVSSELLIRHHLGVVLRHSYATALIQSGENAKTVQTLMGHHSVAFTMDQYADAWPEAISNAGEKAAALLFAASGSKTVATDGDDKSKKTQVIDFWRPRPELSCENSS